MIAKGDRLPQLNNELEVLLCWMDNKPLVPGNKYYLQLNSRLVRSIVREIEYKLNVNTLEKEFNPSSVGLNDIVKATIKTASEMPYDPYAKLQANGGAILIDETSNVTVGACMIQ
jgi:sulfate adenylyltransferase subunit 1